MSEKVDFTFTFLGHECAVKFLPMDVLNEGEPEDQQTQGMFVGSENTVLIADHLSPSRTGEVLLHELTHLCEQKLGYQFEENVIAGISGLLYGLLAENPKVLKVIFPKH